MQSAPVPTNVRYASDTDRFLRRSEMKRCANKRYAIADHAGIGASVSLTFRGLHTDSHHAGRDYVPCTLTPQLIGVWFCVGFFTGAGWAIAAGLVGRILSVI